MAVCHFENLALWKFDSLNLIDAISANGWALRERTLTDLVALAERHAAGDKISDEEKGRIVAARDQMFSDRMAAYEGARPAWSLDKKAGLEESPLAPASVVEASDAGQTPPYFLVDDVAVVPIHGVLAKHSSMVNGMSQPVGMAYSQIARAVAMADRDTRAKSILLDIHSPGGMVHGIQDATSEIERVAQNKTVVAYAHDLAASGAYWLASAASRIVLSPTADVGSIGVYCVVDDTSQQMKDRKVVRHVVRAGRYKGVGMQGTPVGSEDLAMMQAEVDALATEFVATVAKNRGMSTSKAKEMADGRVWIGAEAVKMGLADEVVTPRQAIESARRSGTAAPRASAQRNKNMEWNELTDAQISSAPADVVAKIGTAHGYSKNAGPASMEQLEATFPGESAFMWDAAKKKLSLDAAKGAYADVLSTRLAEATKKNGELTTANASLQGQVTQLSNAQPNNGTPKLAPGVSPVTTGQGGSGDAGSTFAGAVKAHMKTNKCDKATAMAAIAANAETKPLHRAWCDAGCPAFD